MFFSYIDKLFFLELFNQNYFVRMFKICLENMFVLIFKFIIFLIIGCSLILGDNLFIVNFKYSLQEMKRFDFVF